jgi:hypothetical protein
VRRLLTWVAGAAGGLAAYRAATRRTVEPEPVVVDADPAEELRATLAAARAVEPEPVAADPEPEPELQDTDARRRSVHDQARSALDEMRGDET